MIFLDPNKPLHTCKEKSCEGCNISHKLVCHFNGRQLALFMLLSVPLLFSGYIIYNFNSLLLIPWIIFTASFFGFIEIRVMCSHCPHYAEPEITSLKCWANYGAPKLWKYRPGPMTLPEKIIFILGFIIILSPPIIILIIQNLFIMLIVYLILLTGWKLLLRTFYCKKCINFACTFNAVNHETKNAFFEKNPVVKDAWRR